MIRQLAESADDWTVHTQIPTAPEITAKMKLEL